MTKIIIKQNMIIKHDKNNAKINMTKRGKNAYAKHD
jgi:hypothetical protein